MFKRQNYITVESKNFTAPDAFHLLKIPQWRSYPQKTHKWRFYPKICKSKNKSEVEELKNQKCIVMGHHNKTKEILCLGVEYLSVFNNFKIFLTANLVWWIRLAPKCWLPERVNLGENTSTSSENHPGVQKTKLHQVQGKYFTAPDAFRLLKTPQWRSYPQKKKLINDALIQKYANPKLIQKLKSLKTKQILCLWGRIP